MVPTLQENNIRRSQELGDRGAENLGDRRVTVEFQILILFWDDEIASSNLGNQISAILCPAQASVELKNLGERRYP